MLQLNEAFIATFLFPFAAFMVEDFHVVSRSEDIGYYAGILASVFFGAQFCTSFFWGHISDKVGRKLAMLTGLVGSVVGLGVFGFSRTYAQAILGRALSGALSGNIGASILRARFRVFSAAHTHAHTHTELASHPPCAHAIADAMPGARVATA